MILGRGETVGCRSAFWTAPSFSFASAQRQRSRGEGQDEGQRRPRSIHAPAGTDERLQNEILDMARAISAMQREIQAISANGATTTTHVSSADDLDDVVLTTEQATTTILSAAERVQEFAWTLRENAGRHRTALSPKLLSLRST